MAININENGTIKTISDNLHPGSVFLLDLLDRPLRDLGITEEHFQHLSDSSNQYMTYATSFELGFEAHVAFLLCLVGGERGITVSPYISNKIDQIRYFTDASGSNELFGRHYAQICFQGNSFPYYTSGGNRENFAFYIGADAPHTIMAKPSRYDIMYSVFSLQGSKLNLYSNIYSNHSSTYAELKDKYCYFPSDSYYNIPYMLVIAI